MKEEVVVGSDDALFSCRGRGSLHFVATDTSFDHTRLRVWSDVKQFSLL